MAVSVEMEHIAKAFGKIQALDDVSLSVAPGELFFLLGPSGCGKTTLLRSLAGFCTPDRGTFRVDGVDLAALPPHKRDLGMVFQSYALWPHMTVRENVAFGLEQRNIARAEAADRVDEALRLVQMSDCALRRPAELSGGQQQRVALARALVIQPRGLLLDEPLSNLDAQLRLDMRTEIRRLCKAAGLTALYVTHDQKEALSIADRLAVLRDGRVEQVGTPLEVYGRPANRFVAGFIGEANFIEGRLVGATPDGFAVDTPFGRLVARAAPTRGRDGDAVTVCLRPESLRLGAPPADAGPGFRGLLHDTVYLGEIAQHQVHVGAANGSADGLTLKACELRPRRVARDQTHEAIAWWVDPEDVLLFPA